MSDELKDKHFMWLDELNDLEAITVRRCYFKIDTTLVISKNKIAPIKRPSVPRLELLAALITSRSVHCVKEALETLNKVNIDKVYFWPESFTTLFWIKGVNKQWKMFVENQVKDIRELPLVLTSIWILSPFPQFCHGPPLSCRQAAWSSDTPTLWWLQRHVI